MAASLRSNPRRRDRFRRDADVVLRAAFFRDLRGFEDGDIKMLGRVATRIVTDGSPDAYPARAKRRSSRFVSGCHFRPDAETYDAGHARLDGTIQLPADMGDSRTLR